MLKKFTKLNRTLIHIKGSDRFNFLQGLLSQDVTKVTSSQSLYSLLLTPQGKFLHDMFLIPENSENTSLLIECDSERSQDLLNRLKIYKLRSDVFLNVIPNTCVLAFWNSTGPIGKTSITSNNHITYQDPRLQDLGGKLITLAPSENLQHILKDRGFSEGSFEDYQTHLLKLGVPSDIHDMIPEKSIPLECGMDELHAIDWKKGCYMGQELTARTRYRGLIRKRLIPGMLEGLIRAPFKARLMFENSDVGTIRSSRAGMALALIRLEFLKESLKTSKPFSILPPEEDNAPFDLTATFMPYVPYWMKLPEEES